MIFLNDTRFYSGVHGLQRHHSSGGRQNFHRNGKLTVPENPIIPFIRGDGTGPDIWAASERVFDAAVKKAYGGKKKISWFEVFAGESFKTKFNNWLPDDTVEAFKEFLVGIKGPLTTPVGGGIRSLNVALRQMLDLYVCLRPVQYFQGVPSPGEASGKGRHGHLPRKHRGHLRRHRIRRRRRPRRRRCSISSQRNFRRISKNPLWHQGAAEEFWKAVGRKDFPATSSRSRHQAGQLQRLVRAQRHQVRHQVQAQERHDCPQGQHHEVHRGRLPRLGL
jgi:hypothetical protein